MCIAIAPIIKIAIPEAPITIRLLAKIPANRLGKPEDVAYVSLFLASKETWFPRSFT